MYRPFLTIDLYNRHTGEYRINTELSALRAWAYDKALSLGLKSYTFNFKRLTNGRYQYRLETAPKSKWKMVPKKVAG